MGLKFEGNQWKRRKIASRLREIKLMYERRVGRLTKGQSLFQDFMLPLNAHISSVVDVPLEEIPALIAALSDKQELVLACFETTQDEDERYIYEAMDLYLGTLRQELKGFYAANRQNRK